MNSSCCRVQWSAKLALSVGLALSAPVVLGQEIPGVPKLKFCSVFSQYQGFNDQALTPWRESNDTVRNVGGWRAYAREANAKEIKPSDVAVLKADTCGEPRKKP